MLQRGTLAGSMQSQQFGQDAQKAAAADAIAKFNAGNTQQANLANTGYTNDQIARMGQGNLSAGQFNQNRTMGVNTYNTDLANRKLQDDAARAQELSQLNTGLVNQGKDASLASKQQNFDNLMNIAAGRSGQYAGAADRAATSAGQSAAASGAIRGAILGGASQAAAAYAGKK